MDEIVSTVVANGLWAVLFCGLLVYQLRDGRRREQRYTETISALADRLKTVEDIKDDTSVIREATERAEAKKPRRKDKETALGTTETITGGVPCNNAI